MVFELSSKITLVVIAKLSRAKFALTIQAPGDSRAKFVGNYNIKRTGHFESLSIRERRISLWRKRGSDLGGGPEGVWSRERRGGRERRCGAEDRERAIPGAQTANVKAR